MYNRSIWLDMLENEIHYENMQEADHIVPKNFTLRYSARSIRYLFILFISALVVGILCLISSNGLSWRILGGVFVGLGCMGTTVAIWQCFWKCEVNTEQILVKCLFYRKRILWSEITSAEWKERARLGSTAREYYLILRSGEKKRLELDSTMKGLPKMKRLVKKKKLIRTNKRKKSPV